MKKKISKILGVVLSLALLSSLSFAAVPVSAAGDPDVINEWETVAMPNTLPHSDVGPMAIAPDGTLYATVVEWVDGGDGSVPDDSIQDSEWLWSVKKSIDGGFTWTTTALAGLDAAGGVHDVMGAVDIQCSPNYLEDGRIYVAFLNGDIYRLQNEGAGPAILLKPIEDEATVYLPGNGLLYDIDLWSDGESVWVLVACTLDVLVLEDTTFAEWLDQDLSEWVWDENAAEGEDYIFNEAYECAFAPDFDTSSRLWAIMGNWSSDSYEFELWAISTVSPGQWGQQIDEVHFETPDEYVDASPYVDLAFPEFYDSEDAPVFYAALTEFGEYQPNYSPTYDGNLFLVQAAYKPDVSEAEALLPYNYYDVPVVSVEVAGEVILAGSWASNTIYRSENMGSTWDVIGYDYDTDSLVGSGPTGSGQQIEWWGTWWNGFSLDWYSWTHVYMAPGFDAEDGVAYVSTVGGESAVSRSKDGGVTYQQVGLIDTEIFELFDVAFSPEGGSQPAMMLTVSTSNDASGPPPVYTTNSLWRTTDIDAETPMYERVTASGSDPCEPWNFLVRVFDVEYALDGSAIMAFGVNTDSGNLVVWKSTDGGTTFTHWRTMPTWVNDWVVLDGATIYCAASDGFYGTSRFGPPTSEHEFTDALGNPVSNWLVDIALQPGFDPDDPDMSTIIVGNDEGDVLASLDAGDNWGYANFVGTVDTMGYPIDPNFVYVDFDAGFNGTTNTLIYAADSGGDSTPGTVRVGELVGTTVFNVDSTVVGFEALEDYGEDTATGFFTGLVVSPGAEATGGNALYAMSAFISGSTGTPASTASGGWVTVKGDDSYVETTASVPATDITLISGGPFINGEVLSVIATALIFDTTEPDTVGGTIVIEGAISGAVGQISVTLDVDSDALWDTMGVDGETCSIIGSSLIAAVSGVVPDVPDTPAQLWRLLLHEEENVWENASDVALTTPYSHIATNRLWLTTGTNLVWTVDLDTATLWVLEDTVPIPIANVRVTNIGETSAVVSWNAMTGALQYEYKWTRTDPITSLKVTDRDETAAATPITPAPTTAMLTGLIHNTKYTVKVRVVEGMPFTSRWSAATDFTTLETINMPKNLVPENGMQGAPLLPSFLWEAVPNAISYEFELSTDPAFGTTVVATVISAPTTGYTCTTELNYDQNYYWRVRAVSATGTKSLWCVFNFHTMVEEMPPVTVPPAPTPTVILPTPVVTVEVPPVVTVPPAPTPTITVSPPEVTVEVPTPTVTTVQPVIEMPEEVTPAYIWAIVAIGALLTLAVIILIIRTRRVV